jgi:hypothetical protein
MEITITEESELHSIWLAYQESGLKERFLNQNIATDTEARIQREVDLFLEDLVRTRVITGERWHLKVHLCNRDVLLVPYIKADSTITKINIGINTNGG